MTGRQGFHGDLTAAGIINQIFAIPESPTLTNLVFMGMGEPMDNIDEVLKALEVLTAPWGLDMEPEAHHGVEHRQARFTPPPA